MRIIVSAFACDPYAGSEPGIGYNFSTSLAREGHDVWCITSPRSKDNIERDIVELGLKNIKFVYISPRIFGERLYRNKFEMYLYYMLWLRDSALAASEIIKVVDIDIIHHITWGSLQFACNLSKLKRPLFFGPAGGGQFTPPGFDSYFTPAERKSELFRKIMSFVLTRFFPSFRETMQAAKCVYVSNVETEKLATGGGCRKAVLLADPALTEDWRFEADETWEPGNNLKLLWVGRLLPRKGLNFTLEALSRTTRRNWTLTIIGDGEQAEFIDSEIAKLRLEANVVRVGKVEYSKMKSFYSSHDLYITTPLRESVGVQLLEAMACGLPILTLNIHGAASFIPTGAGFKIEVTSPAETSFRIAAKVDELCVSPWTLKSMRAVARASAEPYFWSAKIKKILADYSA